MDNTRPFATPEEVATYLGYTTQRLAKHRVAGTGPLFVKDGRRVFYKWSDVHEWVAGHTVQHTTGR